MKIKERKERKRNMMKKIFENAQLLVLMVLIVAQCVIGRWWYIGQFLYLAANGISIIRSFVLKRPMADKVKDTACFALTLGLILFN